MRMTHEVRHSHPRRKYRRYDDAAYKIPFVRVREDGTGVGPVGGTSQVGPDGAAPVGRAETEHLKQTSISQLGGTYRRVVKDRDGNVISNSLVTPDGPAITPQNGTQQ